MALLISRLFRLPDCLTLSIFVVFVMSANLMAAVKATDVNNTNSRNDNNNNNSNNSSNNNNNGNDNINNSNNNNNNNNNMIEYHEVAKFQHFNEPFDQRVFGKLNIEVIEVTPTSIHVKWTLSNMTHPDSIVESTFLCETFNGRIVSDKLHSDTDSFRFQFLNSDTTYLICVHLLEKSPSTNTSILHYNCQSFATIPVLRSDSILGVGLTVGYLVGVLILGYLAWYRKSRKMKCNEDKEKLKTDENVADKDDDYSQFAQIAGRGGFSNYVVDEDYRRLEANGDAQYKSKSTRGDCSGACVPFNMKEEEALVEYNAKEREISF